MAVGATDYGEWEYEYSATESETIYVDLDLSSANGVIKSTNAGDRKTLKGPNRNGQGDSRDENAARPETELAGDDDMDNDNDNEEDNENEVENDNDNAADEDGENGDNQEANSPPQAPSPREPGLLDEDYAGRMQILDFDSKNPIVSFKGQLYSCTWHDMLGTSMFITKHQEAPFHEPEISTEDYDLIGTSHIKLVGRRARVVPKTGSKKRRREEDNEDTVGEADTATAATSAPPVGTKDYVPPGKSLGTIIRTNPKTNIEIKQQASFLERLMEVKKARGESDVVRTFVDRRTISADVRQARKAKMLETQGANVEAKKRQVTKEQQLRREIQELNKRVVKGDNEALERLQEIYADMEEVDDEDEEDEIFVQDSSAPALANNPASTGEIDVVDAGLPRDRAEGGGGAGGGGSTGAPPPPTPSE